MWEREAMLAQQRGWEAWWDGGVGPSPPHPDPNLQLRIVTPKPTQPQERVAEAGRDTLLFWIRSGLFFIPNWFKIN